MIWPLIARNPAAASVALKRSNRTSIADLPSILARVSAARKVQICWRRALCRRAPDRESTQATAGPDQIFSALVRQVVAGR
jgi:hypothetical protein